MNTAIRITTADTETTIVACNMHLFGVLRMCVDGDTVDGETTECACEACAAKDGAE